MDDLHWAARDGDTVRLQHLLTAGQCNINGQDRLGRTPLHWAAHCGHTQCVQLLLQHGADTSIQDRGGKTPLHWAADCGHTQCVQLLLQHGADTNIQDDAGRTPLHWAADHGHTQCVQLLLQHGADTSNQDKDFMTPLHWDADHGHTQCVQLLLQHGADTSITAYLRMTPLHLAASGGHTQCVQLLLQHGADTSKHDIWRNTPLHLAASGGHTQCVQLLLQHGADTSKRDHFEMTPLHRAAHCGHTQCVQLLLQHGADTSIQDTCTMTPLHWAARGGHTQCVQLLLQHGADTSVQDKGKETPRMLAEEGKLTVVVELLRRFEIHDIQVHIQTRTLEHLAEILDPEEYSRFNLTNLNPKCPDIFQFQKIQGVKDWIAKNNRTTIKDIRDGLLTANLPRLSSAAVQYYAAMVANISDMSPNEFESLCRTLTTAKYMCQNTPSSSTRGLDDTSLPLDQYRHDAFIAYSGEDEATIEPVLHQLKECGIECFYAKEDLALGTYVITSIIEAVSSSRLTIVFLSKSFIQSNWCQLELQYIIENARTSKGHVVIPVVMKMAPEEIPRELSIWKYILFSDEELITKLLEAFEGPRDTPKYGQLRHENKVLRDENEDLRAKNDVLRDENSVLRDENEVLRDEVRHLTAKLRPQSR